jgi:hypothetical protein
LYKHISIKSRISHLKLDILIEIHTKEVLF